MESKNKRSLQNSWRRHKEKEKRRQAAKGPKSNFRAFRSWRQGPSEKFNWEGEDLEKFAHFWEQKIYIE